MLGTSRSPELSVSAVNIEGSFKFGDMELYVNRGLGTVGLPFRLNCPAEITHFTLARA